MDRKQTLIISRYFIVRICIYYLSFDRQQKRRKKIKKIRLSQFSQIFARTLLYSLRTNNEILSIINNLIFSNLKSKATRTYLRKHNNFLPFHMFSCKFCYTRYHVRNLKKVKTKNLNASFVFAKRIPQSGAKRSNSWEYGENCYSLFVCRNKARIFLFFFVCGISVS